MGGTDGPGVSFGVGRVTRGTCDKEDSSRVWTDAPNLMSRYYRSPQRRSYVLVEPGHGISDIGTAADEACDETQHGVRTGPLDRLDIGGATSHLLAMPTQRQLTSRTHVKLHRRLVMGRDVDHEEDFSGPLPHDTTGFSLVEVCFTYVPTGASEGRGGEDPRPRRARADAGRLTRLPLAARAHDEGHSRADRPVVRPAGRCETTEPRRTVRDRTRRIVPTREPAAASTRRARASVSPTTRGTARLAAVAHGRARSRPENATAPPANV
jgi:hypothetical protein